MKENYEFILIKYLFRMDLMKRREKKQIPDEELICNAHEISFY